MSKQPAVTPNPIHERIRQAFAGAHAGRIGRISTEDPDRLVYDVTLVKPLPEKANLPNHSLTVLDIQTDRASLTVMIPADWLPQDAPTPEPDPLATEELPAAKDADLLTFDERAFLRALFNKWEQGQRGWVELGNVPPLEKTMPEIPELVARDLIEHQNLTQQARITRAGCAAIHVAYPLDALGQPPDPIVESLEALYKLDPEKDRAQYIETLRALWQTVDPTNLTDEDMTRLKAERDLALTSVELLTAARVSLQNEVERLKAVNERQSEMLRAVAGTDEEWETLHHEIHSPDDWKAANRELASKRRDGWEIVKIETEAFPTENGRPYMTLRFVTLKRAARWAPQPEPEKRETKRVVEAVEPLGSYSLAGGARVVMPEPVGDPVHNSLNAALNQPLVRAIREKGVAGVLADWDTENRQTFLDALARHAPNPPRYTLIPGRPETEVDALPLLAP